MSSGPAAPTPALRVVLAESLESCVGSENAAPLERLAELAGPAFETGARWSILIMAAS
jgi:hypothetical protein